MKNKYYKCSLEDLIEDRDFISWVLKGNNEIYWEGDVIEGKEIVKIEKDYVVLRGDNIESYLRLGGKK